MKVKLKLNVLDENEKVVIGPGTLMLLDRINEYKSINKASKSLNLSYVKALRLLKRFEERTGKRMLLKKRGGFERGGTELTNFAQKYLQEYRLFQEKINDFAKKEFIEFEKNVNKIASE